MKEKIETKNENLDTENQIKYIGNILKEFLCWEDLKEKQPTLYVVLQNLPKEKLDKISTKFRTFEDEYTKVMRLFDDGGYFSNMKFEVELNDILYRMRDIKICDILDKFIEGEPYSWFTD